MLKFVSAMAIAVALIGGPAVAQPVEAPVAPVAPPLKLPSSGLGAGAIAGGAVLAGLVTILILGSDDDDGTPTTTTTTTTN